jgi:hypothetical protein
MIAGHLEPERDGPEHLLSFDTCSDPHERVQRGRRWAVEDSRRFIDAAMSGDSQAVESLLDESLQLVEGCTEDNDWCDTRPPPELENDPPQGCSVDDRRNGDRPLLFLVMLGLGLLRRGRRRSRAGRAALRLGRAWLPALVMGLLPTSANAQPGSPSAPETDPKRERPLPEAETHRREFSSSDCGPLCRPLAGEVRIFGGLNDLAFGFAAELQFGGPRFGLAGGMEINPWVRHDDFRITAGSLSPYLSGHHRLPFGRFTLRQRISIGASILLEDAHPHAAGSTGPFFEFAPLGVELYGRRARFAFVLDGVSIALPIVAVGEDLLVHPQYRVGFGFRF